MRAGFWWVGGGERGKGWGSGFLFEGFLNEQVREEILGFGQEDQVKEMRVFFSLFFQRNGGEWLEGRCWSDAGGLFEVSWKVFKGFSLLLLFWGEIRNVDGRMEGRLGEEEKRWCCLKEEGEEMNFLGMVLEGYDLWKSERGKGELERCEAGSQEAKSKWSR